MHVTYPAQLVSNNWTDSRVGGIRFMVFWIHLFIKSLISFLKRSGQNYSFYQGLPFYILLSKISQLDVEILMTFSSRRSSKNPFTSDLILGFVYCPLNLLDCSNGGIDNMKPNNCIIDVWPQVNSELSASVLLTLDCHSCVSPSSLRWSSEAQDQTCLIFSERLLCSPLQSSVLALISESVCSFCLAHKVKEIKYSVMLSCKL